MRDIFVTVLILSTLPFILGRPYIGVLAWSWIGYMNPHRLTWGFAFDFPFAQIIAITLIISFVLSKESKQVPWTRESVVLLLLTLWMFLSTIFSAYPWLAWVIWDKVWKIQLITFITMILMKSRERIDLLVWVIVLSLGFYGVKGGLFTVATGGHYLVLGPAESFIATRGTIALALNMVIPLMRYLQLRATKTWVRHGLTVAMILTGFAVIGTSSRGGFLAFIAMGFMMMMKMRRKSLYVLLAIPIALLIFSFMPSEWEERMATLTNPDIAEENASAHNRIQAWIFAYETALQHPWMGGGFEIFSGVDAHSIWFEVLGENGFVGLGLYLLLWIMIWRTASWIKKAGKRDEEIKWMADLAGMLQASLVAYAVGGTFVGMAHFDLFYHLVAIVVLLKVVLHSHLRQKEMATHASTRRLDVATVKER